MKTKTKILKRKLGNFIERVKLSESEYLMMKDKSEKFDGMMSTCDLKLGKPEFTEIKDKEGNVLYKFPKNRTATLNVNVNEMLKEAGVIYGKDRVKLNVE